MFVVGAVLKLFLYPSILLMLDSRSAYIIDDVLRDFRYLLNANISVSLEGITTPQTSLFHKSLYFHTLFCVLQVCFLF